MSEQTIQDGLYSIPVELDKYTCRSLGATTIKDLVKNKEISGLFCFLRDILYCNIRWNQKAECGVQIFQGKPGEIVQCSYDLI